MMSETTEEDLYFSSSASDTDETNLKSWRRREETTPKCSLVYFILGFALTAPFITYVCAAQDVLAGTEKPTGFVIIALTAPSCVLKIVSLCFQHVSQIARVFVASGFVLVGQLCTVFIPHLGGRFAGICLISVGTGIGEISLLIQTARELEEIALCSFLVGTGVGGVLGAASHVGKLHKSIYLRIYFLHLLKCIFLT